MRTLKNIMERLSMKIIAGRLMLIIALFSVISCDEDTDSGAVDPDKELALKLSIKATETLRLSSGTYKLEADIWRNFTPQIIIDVPDPYWSAMISGNRLINLDGVKIPDNIDLVKQYVISKESVWIVDYTNESRPDQPEYILEKVSRQGPFWEPGIYVDVIAQIHDSDTNKDYYIRHKNVKIGAAY